MITTHANSGIDALHAALTSADTQLEHISTRLQSELSLNYPQPSTNPCTLLQRLRTLQNDLPALREQLFTIHQQKAELVTKCKTDLEETTRFARRILPVAVSSGLDPSSIDDELTQAGSSLSALLSEFRRVNAGFVERTDVRDQELSLALLRAVADVNIEPPEEMKDDPPDRKEQADEKESTVEKKLAKLGNGKSRKAASGGNKVVVVKSPKSEFVPVSKVVYNRLPRNLKIKAGKLPQINEFYEKVFNVLNEASAPLSDAELRNATGENDMTKFEVLRGLAVVRHSKQGWMLAC